MRLLIVDDHEVVRRGVRSLLLEETNHEICGEAIDGLDAIEKCRDLKPDLVVMDVSMPRLNGLEATRQIRSILPDCQILVLSQHDSSEMARQALKAGARGYVVKNSISNDLVAAIAIVLRGQYFFDPSILNQASPTHMDVQEILQRSVAFEKALRENEERLRRLSDYQSAVMNNMAEGLYALDRGGLLTSINRAGEAILGWSKDELLGKKMHDLTHSKHPDGSQYPASECPVLQAIKNGTALREHEDIFVHRDGRFVPVVLSISPLKEDGTITGAIVSFRDDTEPRRAREALLHTKRELELSLDHLQLVTKSMAVSVTRCSKDLRFLWVNQRYSEWFGQPAEQLVGSRIEDVIGQEAFDKLLPYFKRVLSGERVSYEEEVAYKNIGPRWISAVYTPTLDATGTPDGWVAVVLDVTEQKRTEDAQLQSQEQVVLALEASKSAMFDWDLIRGRGCWNSQMAAIYEFEPSGEYITAEEWLALFHPEDVERLRREAQQFWRDGSEFSFEFRTVPKDGRMKWISSHGRIVRRADGKAVRMIGTHSDITDRKLAERALKESESRMRAAFSHSYSFLALLEPDGTIIDANRAALDAAGGDRARVIGRKFWEPWWSNLPHEAAILKKVVERVATGHSVRDECCFSLADGTRRLADRTLTPVTDQSGNVVMILATGLDITERRESEKAIAAWARQQRALFYLADALHRAGSMDQVYDSALNAILDALQCNRASILLCDDAGVMRFKSWRGLSNEYRAATEGHSAWRSDEKNPQPVCISDIETAELDEPIKSAVKLEGIAALAFIPLVSKGGLSGKFMAYFNAPRALSDKEIELGLTIARQLAFAIERIHASEALRQSKRQLAQESEALKRLNDCTSRLWRARSLEDGLEEMLSATIELLSADKGNVQLLNPERGTLSIVAQQGFEKEFLGRFGEVSANDQCACGRALQQAERVVIEDVDQDARFAPYLEVARAADFRAVISTPLTGTGGALLGILSTHFRKPHRPSLEELRRLDLYVGHASGFIERCQLDQGLRNSEERLRSLAASLDSQVSSRTIELENKNAELVAQSEHIRELSQDLLRTQDEERRHISRELHDSAGQTLAVLRMSVAQFVHQAERVSPELAKPAAEMEELVRQLEREVRTASYLLHPPLLDETGLCSALKWYVEGLAERSQIAIALDIPDDFGRLPSEMELTIFRLVQECLTNIHRHSESKTAEILITRDAAKVEVKVKDEGKGMPPERLAKVQSGASGVGIRGMRERVRRFRGEIMIESGSLGTCVTARIPVPSEASSREVARVQSAGRNIPLPAPPS